MEKQNLPWNDDRIAFLGNSELPTELCDLEEPFRFFSKFINEDIVSKIVDETK